MLSMFFMVVNESPNRTLGLKGRCCTLNLLLPLYREFTEFNETGAEGWPGLISRYSRTIHSHWPAEILSIGQAACNPLVRSPPLPCRLSFARALPWLAQQPQQDSIKPCASCVIPTSCTQGQECSAVFVCRGRPVSSPVPMSLQSRTGKPKNIQLCAWKPRRLSGDETTAARSLFLSNSSPH